MVTYHSAYNVAGVVQAFQLANSTNWKVCSTWVTHYSAHNVAGVVQAFQLANYSLSSINNADEYNPLIIGIQSGGLPNGFEAGRVEQPSGLLVLMANTLQNNHL